MTKARLRIADDQSSPRIKLSLLPALTEVTSAALDPRPVFGILAANVEVADVAVKGRYGGSDPRASAVGGRPRSCRAAR